MTGPSEQSTSSAQQLDRNELDRVRIEELTLENVDLSFQVTALKSELAECDRAITDLGNQIDGLTNERDNLLLERDRDQPTSARDSSDPAALPAASTTYPVPVIGRPTMPQIGGLDR